MADIFGVQVVRGVDYRANLELFGTTVTAVVGTADTADAETFPYNTPVLVSTDRARIGLLGDAGELKRTAEALLREASHHVVVIRVPYDAVELTQADFVTGGTDAVTGEKTGLVALETCESVVFLRPSTIICPTFSKNPNISAVMVSVAEKIGATVFIDSVGTNNTEIIAQRNAITSKKATIVEGYGYFYDNSVKIDIEPSTYYAGALAKGISLYGEQRSPSNIDITSISGVNKSVDYLDNDPTCASNLLNTNDIGVITNINGIFKTKGNRNCASTFIAVERIHTLIDRNINSINQIIVDAGIGANYADTVISKVNILLEEATNNGLIFGGSCRLNGTLNTQATMSQGIVYFDVEFTPIYPAEKVIFTTYTTADRLINILGDA